MNGKVIYHQQVSYCGKPRCKRCREGIGHGPYWYAYKTVDGRTTRTYVGKQLPPEVQATMNGGQEWQEKHMPSLSESDHAMLRMYVLGQFRLERREDGEWQTITEAGWQHQRVRMLLACLLSATNRKMGREQLLDALWPELDLETASSRLDRAVHSLRQLFEPSRSKPASSPLLLTERELLVLVGQQFIWIDADAFEQTLTKAHASTDVGTRERLLEEAMMLYGGELLPEERKVESILARRDALQRSWIGLLLELADLRISRDALNGAIEPLDRLMAADPTNEAAVRRLMILLIQLGRRAEAIRAYKRLAKILHDEYRIAPLPDTRNLYESIRAGKDIDLSSGSSPTSTQTESATERPTERPTGRPTEGHSAGKTPETVAIQIGRAHQSPLVGRSQELELLRGLLAKTEQGTKFKLSVQKKLPTSLALDTQRNPQAFLLLGEVGIGKTRLAEEIGREARRRNWVVAWSRVYAQEGNIPYRLWIEVMQKAMLHGSWQRQEISKRFQTFQPLTKLLPDLGNLLPPAQASTIPPEQEQLHLREAVYELLITISNSSPLLIVLDDLQWADASSCELLAYLARHIYGYPIIIIGTCRDNELAPDHVLRPLLTDLQREHALDTLSLQPLSDEQIGTLVSQISQIAQVPRIAEPVVQHIQDRAAGNPFFAEELARSVSMVNTFGPNDHTRQNGATNDMDILPDTITAVLDLRLSRLSRACQRLLSKAAVLGGSFEFQLIQEMEANNPGSNEDTVLELLEEAMQSGMLSEEGIGTRITYQFWHPLLVSHLYEGLSAARRASLHRRAADILQKFYAGRERDGAAIITHHLINGGADPQLIVHYAELAGDRAYTLSAYPDAEKHYRIAVDYLGQIVGTPEDQLHSAYLFELLGECTRVQGKNEEARHFYEEALALRIHSYAPVSDPLHETQIRAMLLCEIGVTWYNVGNKAKAQEYYEHSEQVLQGAGIETGPVWAYIRFHQSRSSWRQGNYEEALRIGNEALTLFETAIEQREQNVETVAHLRRSIAGDPVDLGRIHVLLGLIAVVSGQYADTFMHLETALTLFEQHDNQREIAIVCCNLGDLYLKKAEYSQAQSVLRRSLSIAERIGEVPLISFALGNMSVLDVRTGNLTEAEKDVKGAITLAEQMNDLISISMFHSGLATILQEQEKLSEAMNALYRALMLGRTKQITPCIGFALVALGSIRITQALSFDLDKENGMNSRKKKLQLLERARKTLQHATSIKAMEAEMQIEGQLALARATLLLGDIEDAQGQATRALSEARSSESTWLIARTQRLLGDILIAQRQREEASRFYEQAMHTFRRSGMRLEYGRTLQSYSKLLIQHGEAEGSANEESRDYRRGWEYLKEARQIFSECGAMLDVRLVERVIAEYERWHVTNRV